MISLRTLVVEGKYDKYVTELSRWVVTIAKGDKKTAKTKIVIEPIDQEVIVIVNIYRNHKLKFGNVAVNADAPVGTDEIYINVYIKENPAKTWINELIGQLKNYIRHEIEHLSQEYFDEKPKMKGIPKGDKKYLTAPHEVPALVQGMYKQAKTERKPLSKVMNTYLDSYKLKPNDKKDVLVVWNDFIRKNLPRAK